jgi:hypothetical protein
MSDALVLGPALGDRRMSNPDVGSEARMAVGSGTRRPDLEGQPDGLTAAIPGTAGRGPLRERVRRPFPPSAEG